MHEVYLKLSHAPRDFADQQHLVYTAAASMRQILVDHARTRQRIKRGGGLARVTFDGLDIAAPQGIDVLALHDALERLQSWDARQARIVELRFFAGMSVEEVAALMGISEKTVKRDWAMARAWLQRELTGETPAKPGT